jgi:hypothetical protein
MRFEDVQNGFAGLFLSIEGNGTPIAFDNMQKQNIHGIRDWQKYEITLPLDEAAQTNWVAGIMNGKEKTWFDNFVIFIDGKDIQTL